MDKTSFIPKGQQPVSKQTLVKRNLRTKPNTCDRYGMYDFPNKSLISFFSPSS
ncbi:hypothetical protein YC2023_063834 [Brassica napus]